jgi:hypothetical protein
MGVDIDLYDAWNRITEEIVRTLVDYFDVIGVEIADIPTTSRFGRMDVSHDTSRSDSM